jgi:hypothetical protein
MHVLPGGDCDADEDNDVRANQSISNVGRLRRLGLLGEVDSSFDQKWLAEVEGNQT